MTHDPHLAALLTTHADQLQALLPPHLWPLAPVEIRQYGPLTKYTLGPDGDEWLHLHHLTEADSGAPHDHPTRMDCRLLKGSYTERIWHLRQGEYKLENALREAGDRNVIEADRIHLLTSLPEGEVWTLARTGPVVREWRHYPELLT